MTFEEEERMDEDLLQEMHEIEVQAAQFGMEVFAARLVKGARGEGASWRECVIIAEAWFRSLQDPDPDPGE